MTKRDQRQFVHDLLSSIRDDIHAAIQQDRIPRSWDEIELREYIADKVQRSRATHALVGRQARGCERTTEDRKEDIMTTQGETIFVTSEGEAGPQQELVPSVSIANLLQQRTLVIELLDSACAQIRHAFEIAQAARLGFPDISVSRDWRGQGRPMTGDFANLTEIQELCQTSIDAGGWEMLLNDSGLRSLMSAAKRQEVDDSIRNKQVLALTRETIVATFRTLHESRADMFEQGVINCFKQLSWDYSTNLPQKFGKRIVMAYLTS